MCTCILCSHTPTKVLQQIKVEYLTDLYQEAFGMDVNREFHGKEGVNFYHCPNCDLRYFDTEFAGSAQFYEDLQQHRKVYYSPDRPEFTLAAEFINATDSVLEIGSGSGFFATMIEAKQYTGLEFNEMAINEAAKKGIKLVNSTVEDFAEKTEESFDVVCSFHVLEHVVNPWTFFESSLALLRPGGILMFAVPCEDSWLTGNMNHILNLPPHHVSRWSLASGKKLAELFDMKLKKVIQEPVKKQDRIAMVSNKLTRQYYRVFAPNEPEVVHPATYRKVHNRVNKLNKKLSLYKVFNVEKMKAPNMLFVFEKR